MTVTILLLMVWLFLCSVEDVWHKKIHRILLMAGVILCVISVGVDKNILMRQRMFGLLPGGLIFVVSILTKEAIGKADAIMFLIIGGCLGLEQLLFVLLISSMLCACFSAIVLMLRIVRRKDKLPFAPFLLVGMWGLVVLYG